MDEIQSEVSLDTESYTISGTLFIGFYSDQSPIYRFQCDGTTAGTKRTNGPAYLPPRSRPGQAHLCEGPCRAQRKTCPAKGTVGLLKGLIEEGAGTGLETPIEIIEYPFHDQVLIPPDTPGTEDTFAHIPFEEGIPVLRGKILRHGIHIYQAHSQITGNLTELATVSFITDQTGFGM
jgi:hypothetical protein